MFRITSVLTVLVVVALGGALTACGDDDTTASTTTASTTTTESLADFGARIESDCPGEDPGFDVFLGEHPEPTAEDWAGFLPQPHSMVVDLRACLADSSPPAALREGFDSMLAAFDVVIADLAAALAAAEAGDLDGVNAALTEMNSGHVEAIEEAQGDIMDVVAAG